MAVPMEIDRHVLLLPEEITLHVFQFLGFKDLGQAVRVCKYWKHMSEDNAVWRDLYKHHFDETDSLRRRYSGVMLWKHEFHAKKLLEQAWLKGTCKERRVAKYNCRVNCMQFDTRENRVVAGYDGDIHIWDLEHSKVRHTLTGHTEPICYLQYDEEVLVSCSVDRTIRIFNMPHSHRDTSSDLLNGRVLGDQIASKQTLDGHREQVNRLQFDRHRIVSGSRDATVKIWDFATGCCLRTLTGHETSVLCVKYDGDMIASSSGDNTIKLWDARIGGAAPGRGFGGAAVRAADLARSYSSSSLLTSASSLARKSFLTSSCGSLNSASGNNNPSNSGCVRTLVGHDHWVYYLQMHAPRQHLLVSGSRDTTLRVWDLRGGRGSAMVSGGTTTTTAAPAAVAGPVAANEELASSTSTSSALSAVSTSGAAGSGCIAKLTGHSDSVCTLQADANKIVSGSVDRTIRIWSTEDFREKATLEGHNGSVYCLQFEEDLLLSGGGDGNICAFDFAPRGGGAMRFGWLSSLWRR